MENVTQQHRHSQESITLQIGPVSNLVAANLWNIRKQQMQHMFPDDIYHRNEESLCPRLRCNQYTIR